MRGAVAGDTGARSSDLVQSFERGLAVIRAFDDSGPDLTLTEVATRANVTRAAARRFLLTLVSLGYMRTDGKRFTLRPTLLELGNAYLSSMGLADIAKPHMDLLVAGLNESSALCVLEGEDICYVALARRSREIMALNVTIGSRLAAYPTSMGRVLLAEQPQPWLRGYLERAAFTARTPRTVADRKRLAEILTQVQADGYCVVDQELDLGLRSVAVPVRHSDGTIAAALNVSTHPSRHDVEEMTGDMLTALRKTAAEIEADLAAVERRRRRLSAP